MSFTYITNDDISAETKTAFPAGNGINAFVFRCDGDDCTVNIGIAAGDQVGEIVTDGTSSTFTNTGGQLISVYCAGSASYSIRLAG